MTRLRNYCGCECAKFRNTDEEDNRLGVWILVSVAITKYPPQVVWWDYAERLRETGTLEPAERRAWVNENRRVLSDRWQVTRISMQVQRWSMQGQYITADSIRDSFLMQLTGDRKRAFL